MRLLEGREAGEDDIGVTRGLVDPVVHADHALEHRQGGVEAAGLGRAAHRVPRHSDQGFELSLAGRVDLLGQAGDRHLAHNLGGPAYPAVPPAGFEPAGLIGPWQARHTPRHRLGEHEPTGHVEVAGKDVDHVDEPGRHGAELLVAQPDAAVEDGPLGIGQLVSEAADALGRHPTRVLHSLRRERPAVLGQLRHAVDHIAETSEVDQALGEENLHHCHQQRRVGARHNGDPFVGSLGGAGAAGVDHNGAATGLADAVDLAEQVGAGQQRSLGCFRVRPHDHPQVGAGHVRDGEAPHVAVHQERREVLGPLVHRPR